jgi:hypothetical protein
MGPREFSSQNPGDASVKNDRCLSNAETVQVDFKFPVRRLTRSWQIRDTIHSASVTFDNTPHRYCGLASATITALSPEFPREKL